MISVRIIHPGVLDKFYLEAATLLHAILFNNKGVWYLVRTAEERELRGKNHSLWGRET